MRKAPTTVISDRMSSTMMHHQLHVQAAQHRGTSSLLSPSLCLRGAGLFHPPAGHRHHTSAPWEWPLRHPGRPPAQPPKQYPIPRFVTTNLGLAGSVSRRTRPAGALFFFLISRTNGSSRRGPSAPAPGPRRTTGAPPAAGPRGRPRPRPLRLSRRSSTPSPALSPRI